MSLARARFPRPSVQQLQEALPNALSFLIVREPYERLLSAYRNKIEGAKNPYYRKLSKHIAQQSRYNQVQMADVPNTVRSGPTFPEFVDYIINSRKFDEHWAPYHSFCTPCNVNFTVIAKMETLDRDEEYIIHKAGLQRLLLPSHFRFKPRTAINKARDGKATAALVEKYYSQLTKKQMEKLHKIYGTDFEMFDYNATKDGKATAALVEKYYSQLTKKQMEKLHKIYGTDFEMFDYNATKYFNFVQSEQ
uniref:Carbohydrate sulfotransferase n=1 Tax=Locusta migratoria migratoria TaxID=238695 RepID=A0A1B0Y0C1_LOCMI|nr:sulfotransferase [Locusta migratoria migratoria]